MTQQQLYFLAGTLLVIIALIFGRDYWNQYQASQPNEYLTQLGSLSAQDVTQITLSGSDETLQLIKTEGNWRIASKSADPTKITELLAALQPETSPQLLAQSEAQQENLQVTQETATKVTLQTEADQTYTFLVGKATQNLKAVRLADQSKTFGLRDFPLLNLDATHWYDLTVVDLSTEEIQSITFDRPEQDSFTVQQDPEGEWTFSDGSAANSDGIQTFTLAINPLKASKLADESQQQAAITTNPVLSLSLTTMANQTHELTIYSIEEDTYLITRKPNSEAYILTQADFDRLDKQQESFEPVADDTSQESEETTTQ